MNDFTILTQPDLIDRRQWQSLIDHSPFSSFFQSPEAYDFFTQCGEIEPQVFAVEEGERLCGVLLAMCYHEGRWPKNRLSARAVVNGGPLIASDIPLDALRQLLRAAVESLRRQHIYIEIRCYHDYSSFRPAIEAEGFSYSPHYNFHLSCIDSDPTQLIHKKRLYKARRAMKEGANVEPMPTIDDVRAFYQLLYELYRTRVKRPLFSLQFFESIYYTSFAHYFIVKHAGLVIGGVLCVGNAGGPLYEWYACDCPQASKHLYPSTVAKYAAIQYAYDRHFLRFDMMGAGSPNDGGYGVRDFKAEFGGQLVEHGRYLFLCKSFIYQLGKTYMSLKQKDRKR